MSTHRPGDHAVNCRTRSIASLLLLACLGGCASPGAGPGWQTLLDMPPEVAARWPGLDLRAEVAALTDLPVTLLKDTAAACVA